MSNTPKFMFSLKNTNESLYTEVHVFTENHWLELILPKHVIFVREPFKQKEKLFHLSFQIPFLVACQGQSVVTFWFSVYSDKSCCLAEKPSPLTEHLNIFSPTSYPSRHTTSPRLVSFESETISNTISFCNGRSHAAKIPVLHVVADFAPRTFSSCP